MDQPERPPLDPVGLFDLGRLEQPALDHAVPDTLILGDGETVALGERDGEPGGRPGAHGGRAAIGRYPSQQHRERISDLRHLRVLAGVNGSGASLSTSIWPRIVAAAANQHHQLRAGPGVARDVVLDRAARRARSGPGRWRPRCRTRRGPRQCGCARCPAPRRPRAPARRHAACTCTPRCTAAPAAWIRSAARRSIASRSTSRVNAPRSAATIRSALRTVVISPPPGAERRP